MVGIGIGIGVGIGSSSRARIVNRLLSEHPLEERGRILEPHGSVLTPEEILASWRVPAASLLVRAGTVPLAAMREILKDPAVVHQLDPRQFEIVVAEILTGHGFQEVKVTPRSSDGGKDITAHQLVAGIPIYFYFECRRHQPERPVELPELRALLGVVSADKVNKGVLVTTSRFTEGGREFIAQNARVDGKDYDDLVGWIEKLRPSEL